MNKDMVYGVCSGGGGTEPAGYHQPYPSSADLHQYYAHCQAYDQPQTYLSPSLSATDAAHQHRSQALQDGPPSYTTLEEYNNYQHMTSQPPQAYDYAQPNPCAPAPYAGYLDHAAQYRHVSMGLYPHHDAVRECGMAMMGTAPPLPHQQPQQTVPTYKWMQVKRNVPKPGKEIVLTYGVVAVFFFLSAQIVYVMIVMISEQCRRIEW